MYNAVKNEMIKIFSSKKIYVYLIIVVFTNLLPSLEMMAGSIDIPVNGQNIPLLMLGTYAGVILPIFIIIVAVDLITEEYVKGTLKLPLIQQVSRKKLLLAKVIALGVTITFLLGASLVITYLMANLFFEWGMEFIYEEVLHSTSEGVMRTFASYFLTILPLWAFGCFAMLIAFYFLSSSAAIGTAIGLQIFFNFLGAVLKVSQPYLIPHYFTNFAKLFFDGGSLAQILNALVVMLIYGGGAYLIGINIFQKKDMLY